MLFRRFDDFWFLANLTKRRKTQFGAYLDTYQQAAKNISEVTTAEYNK